MNNRRRGDTDGANGSGGGAGTTNGDVARANGTGAGGAHLAIEVHVYTRMCTVQVFSCMYF